jgi:hypothetical protein
MKSQRERARQNLLVAAVNRALERRLITLECEPVTPAAFEFEIVGEPVIASVRDVGFDEISIKVMVRPTAQGRKFIHAAIFGGWRKCAEAYAWAYLERRTGRYLQTTQGYHGTREITCLLSELEIGPVGFGVRPTATGYDFHKECAAIFGTRP